MLPRCGIWGILNVTPDSFSDGGAYLRVDAAVRRAELMLAEGADVIDVGGESSRPAGRDYGAGAAVVPTQEEIRRIEPVVRRVVKDFGAPVSIDTVKPEVAAAAIAAGATIVNDISGGASEALLRIVGEHRCELVLMHNRGRGETSDDNTAYQDVVEDVRQELLERVHRARELGVAGDRIWVDPGLGFAKSAAQSLRLLARIERIVDTGLRVLVGASRKSFIARTVPRSDGSLPEPDERLGGSIAAAIMAVAGGASALRVHDVLPTVQAVRLFEAGRRA